MPPSSPTIRWTAVVAQLVLFLVGSAARSSIAEQRVIVQRVENGTLFWHGHRIAPPYVIEVGFRVDRDTSLVNCYVNDLPMVLPARPGRFVRPSPGDEVLYTRRQDLSKRAAAATTEARARGAGKSAEMEVMAQTYRGDADLVDSVHVESSTGLAVYWRGTREPQHFSMPPRTAESPRRPRMPGSTAQTLIDGLERGCLVLVGAGITTIAPRASKRVLAQIDSFQASAGPAPDGITDRHIVRDLKDPIPIPTLLRRGD